MGKIRVFIADDHNMMREGLSLLLNNQPDIEVVGETFQRDMIEEGMQTLKPDVLLLDIVLIKTHEVRSIASLHKSSPETKIIMLANQFLDESVHRTLNSGARGFIVKQAASAEVAVAIRQVMDGHHYLSPAIMSRVIETYLEGTRTKPRGKRRDRNKYAGYNQLSEREKEIFQLLLAGLSSREISQNLNISSKTADKHRASIFKKTGVENSTQLLHYAIRLKLNPVSHAI
jgi:DNA-binding NarL/FixJ family response regulator